MASGGSSRSLEQPLGPIFCVAWDIKHQIFFIFLFPSHRIPIIFTAILSSSLTTKHQSLILPQHLCDAHWDGYPLLAERGVESVSISPGCGWSALDVNQPCQRLWWLPVSLAHPLTADMIWWEMILNKHVGSQMLAEASGCQRPWQTPLYSFNPKVLKQHLTQIEVGFVCCRGRKKT